jgi:hypothetical protein
VILYFFWPRLCVRVGVVGGDVLGCVKWPEGSLSAALGLGW